MTTEAAIQKDVETVAPGNAERTSRIAEIAEAARKERDAEIVANGGEVVDTLNVSDEPEQEAEQSAPVVEAEKQPEPQTAVVEQEPVEQMVTVKVDGVERQVPQSLVLDAGIRAVQKESAADRRLEEAAQRKREAEQIYEQAQQFARQVKQSPSNEDEAAEMARRFNVDPETVKAIREIAGRDNAIPDEALHAEINQRVGYAINEIQAKEALKSVTKEYSDVFSNPHLVQLACFEDEKLQQESPHMPYAERFAAVGERVRGFVREMKGGKPEVVTSQSKMERKTNITNLPSASVRQSAPEQPKAKTPADIIEEMRKRRGQAA